MAMLPPQKKNTLQRQRHSYNRLSTVQNVSQKLQYAKWPLCTDNCAHVPSHTRYEQEAQSNLVPHTVTQLYPCDAC